MDEQAEVRRERQAEKVKASSSKKVEEPSVAELQSKFMTKPLKVITF